MSTFVILEKHTLAVAPTSRGARTAYSLETVAQLADVHPDMLRYYCKRGLFGQTHAEAEPVFDDDTLYELRRIEHYRRHYGVNRRTLPVVCRLWREVARLEAEIQFLRSR